jgi:hypothetical protein
MSYRFRGSQAATEPVWYDAVCTVLDSSWLTEGPSETCRVLFQNKLNLKNWCIALVYHRNIFLWYSWLNSDTALCLLSGWTIVLKLNAGSTPTQGTQRRSLHPPSSFRAMFKERNLQTKRLFSSTCDFNWFYRFLPFKHERKGNLFWTETDNWSHFIGQQF